MKGGGECVSNWAALGRSILTEVGERARVGGDWMWRSQISVWATDGMSRQRLSAHGGQGPRAASRGSGLSDFPATLRHNRDKSKVQGAPLFKWSNLWSFSWLLMGRPLGWKGASTREDPVRKLTSPEPQAFRRFLQFWLLSHWENAILHCGHVQDSLMSRE